MKTIGLLGGMSWESTREYYDILNKLTQEKFGGSHSCPCIIHSFNFKIIDGFKVEFLENDKNTIDSVKVIQPQGNFIAKRKS